MKLLPVALAPWLLVIGVLSDLNEYRLMDNLLRNYNKKIRPSISYAVPTNVTFGLALSQIIDVDEKNQILTSNCWLNQIWMDQKLRWDPADYGGIKIMRIPYDDVWRPDILLYNNADIMSHFSSISSHVMVTHGGNVTWLSMVIFKSSCTIDVKYFPFDEQNCSMKFASWAYDGYQLNLVHNTDAGDSSNYIENSEWELMELTQSRNVIIYSCCEEPYPDITYNIRVRRRPLFYVFNMMLPCILITLVALLGFYIPSDSGEKVTMGITTLLSMTVFLMLVAESMPPTRNQLPLLGLYYGITIAIVSFATAMTVLTLNIHHKGVRGREVPWIVKKICFCIFARLLCLRLENPDDCLHFAEEEKGHMEKCRDFGGSFVDFKPHTKRTQSHHSRLSSYMPESERNGCETERLHQQNLGATAYHPYALDSLNGAVPGAAGATIYNTLHSSRCTTGGVPPTSASAAPPAAPDTFERQFMKVMQKVYQTIERNEMRIAEQDRRSVIKTEWQQVALVIDRILLWCFVIVTVTITLAIMLRAPIYFWFGSDDEDDQTTPHMVSAQGVDTLPSLSPHNVTVSAAAPIN